MFSDLSKYLPAAFLLLITGCSSMPEVSVKQPSPEFTSEEREALRVMLETYPEYKTLVESWKMRQAGVNRLLSIEKELKLLISQLSALQETSAEQPVPQQAQDELQPVAEADEPQMPDEEPGDNVADEQAAVAPDTNTPIQSTQMPQAGAFGVQLAAMGSTDSLKTIWQARVAASPQAYSGYTPFYETFETNGKRVYRLKTGQFDERDGADALCKVVEATGERCMVTVYSGAERQLPVVND